MTRRRKKGGLGETLKTVFYAVLIAIVIRTFIFEPFRIPSGSMIPTLLVGDYLFVSKYSYGYSRHSAPFSLAPISGRIFTSEPQRGDVVVFKLPSNPAEDYIKRVIGLPGDTVQVKAGRLYVNGEAATREEIDDYVYSTSWGDVKRLHQYVETLPGGARHRILELSDREVRDNTAVYKVPEGHYFMMGDNRDDSRDSRVWEVGYVPAENLVGRAEVVFFSTDYSSRWWEIWKWPGAVRWDRFFNSLRVSLQ